MKKEFHKTARCAKIVDPDGSWAKAVAGKWFEIKHLDGYDFFDGDRGCISIGTLCRWLDMAYAAGLADGQTAATKK